MGKSVDNRKSNSLLQKIGNKMMSIDKYGEQTSFNIAGNSTYQSVFGTIISIFVLAVVIPYGFNKIIVMKERGDTSFQSITIENAFDHHQEFDFEMTKFNMMFFFTNFSLEPVPLRELDGFIDITPFMLIIEKSENEQPFFGVEDMNLK